MRRKRRIVLFGLVFVCVCIVLAVACGIQYRYVSQYPKDRICSNIYIGKVNVSNMTKGEAKKILEEHLQEDRTRKAILGVGDKSAEATLEELGLQYEEIDANIQKAMDYGKEGSLWSRYWKLKKLEKEKLVLPEKITVDSELAESILSERTVPLAEHAVNATIERSGGTFHIEDEKDGQTVDVDASIAKLNEYLSGEWNHEEFSVEMVLVEETPTVRKEDLESIQDVLGTFSTDAGGGNRWQNLITGVGLLNGTVLMPGEEMSFHDQTSPYDAEHGYVEAGSYENGEVVDSFGGGICQVSTTLYNAILYAELEVLERYPHSMLVAYVDPSRDAAIAGDYLDLVFKNSYDTPIYIAGEIDGANQLTFTIYGKETREEGRSIALESETLTTEEYGVIYQEDPEAELGNKKYAGSPHTGKTAQLWKIVYQDGQEISRDVINHSSYDKTDQIIKIGTMSDNSEAAALVRNAISSQDGDQINEAISQAVSLQ